MGGGGGGGGGDLEGKRKTRWGPACTGVGEGVRRRGEESYEEEHGELRWFSSNGGDESIGLPDLLRKKWNLDQFVGGGVLRLSFEGRPKSSKLLDVWGDNGGWYLNYNRPCIFKKNTHVGGGLAMKRGGVR